MLLTYNTYCNLLSAIDEHTGLKYSNGDIANIIFEHYITKYGSFVAENKVKSRVLFKLYPHKSVSCIMRHFRKFMKNKEHHLYLD